MATYESKKYKITGASILSDTIPTASVEPGTVDDTEFGYVNGVTSSIQTQLGARLPLAGGTMTGAAAFGDNVKATFGDGADLEIYHDSSNSYIKNGTGTLKFLEDTYEFKNNADNATYLTVGSSGVTGDFISGQPTSNTGASDDLILVSDTSDSGAMKKITVANAALAGPTGPTGNAGPAGSPGGPGPTGPTGPPGTNPAVSLNIQVKTSGNYTATTGLKWAEVYAVSGAQSGQAVSVYGGPNPYGKRQGGTGGRPGNIIRTVYNATEMGATGSISYGAGGGTSTAPAAPTGGGPTSVVAISDGGATTFNPAGNGSTLTALGDQIDGVASADYWESHGITDALAPLFGFSNSNNPNGSQGSDWSSAQAGGAGGKTMMSNRVSGNVGTAGSLSSGGNNGASSGGAANMPGCGGGGGAARALPFNSQSASGGAGAAGFVVIFEYIQA